MNAAQHPPLVLASTSPYRRELLARLGVAFTTVAPAVDEQVLPRERASGLVQRLATAKAAAVATGLREGLVIGSDQVAVVDGDILGKPGDHDAALEQLRRLSGRRVTFLTGLCLHNAATGTVQTDVVPYHVHFRTLADNTIKAYLRSEEPYNCAGSFKSEGLGITLFERMEGDDPTALIGLPLIRLTTMLGAEGLALPA